MGDVWKIFLWCVAVWIAAIAIGLVAAIALIGYIVMSGAVQCS